MRLLTRTVQYLDRLRKLFVELETPRLAAALAFYIVLSFAPFCLLFIFLAGFIESDLVVRLSDEIAQFGGPKSVVLFEKVFTYSKSQFFLSEHSYLHTSGTLFSLLFFASIIFGELRADMNKIFGSPSYSPGDSSFAYGVGSFVMRTLWSLLTVFFVIILILVSLLVDAYLQSPYATQLGLPDSLMKSFGPLLWYFFAFVLLLKFVPAKRLTWKVSGVGGMTIAIFFFLGRELIGWYLSQGNVASILGATGSVLVFLVWVYYSSLIVFVGAEAVALMAPHIKRLDSGR